MSGEVERAAAIRWAEELCAALHPDEQAEIVADYGEPRTRWAAAAHVACFDAAQKLRANLLAEPAAEVGLRAADVIAAIEALYPSYNYELRYDGTEDPAAAAYVDAFRDIDRALEPFRAALADHAPQAGEVECDHPGLGHGFGMHTGICPRCRKCKFIGHGPLCGDCYDRAPQADDKGQDVRQEGVEGPRSDEQAEGGA